MDTSTGAPRLFAPGPTYVPERIRRALAEPLIHHRAPEFHAMLADVRAKLARLWAAPAWEPLLLCCSGTGAMEGAVVNFMRRDAKALVIGGGKFSERWSKILRAYGCTVIELELEWGRSVDVDTAVRLLDAHRDVRAVYLTSADTSTGAEHPIDVLGPALRSRTDALLVADCVCDFGGARNITPAAWGLDVAVTCSQKCLMMPPGVAIAHVAPRAWKFHATSDLPRFYFDWKTELAKQAGERVTAFTSPVGLFRALQESLAMIEEEGLPQVVRRYARTARAVTAAVTALDLKIFPEHPTSALSVVRCPPGLEGTAVVNHLQETYKVRITNGQERIRGKAFRVGHMGVFSDHDILGLVYALECTVRDLGALRTAPGAAVAAAQRVFSETPARGGVA